MGQVERGVMARAGTLPMRCVVELRGFEPLTLACH
jgi:hypothetical protein